MKRRVAMVVLGGALAACLSVALPVGLTPFFPTPQPTSSAGVRLPQAPAEYPDPNVTWTYRWPGMTREMSIRGVGVYHGWHVTRLRVGWPLPMLEGGDYCEIDSDARGGSGTVHPINVKSWWSQSGKRQWQLPLGLVWSGLGVAGNWLIWSAAIGAIYVPGFLRRSLRLRRGQCLFCGYPRAAGTTTCPECGKLQA